jgi:anti-anti-sigma factor
MPDGGPGPPGGRSARTGRLEILDEKKDATLVIAPAGRVDSSSSGVLESHILERLSQGERLVVIDLADVQYISSAGLRVLLLTLNKLNASGGRLVLCGLGESVREVFELAGFTTIFTIEGSRDLARTRVRQEGK